MVKRELSDIQDELRVQYSVKRSLVEHISQAQENSFDDEKKVELGDMRWRLAKLEYSIFVLEEEERVFLRKSRHGSPVLFTVLSELIREFENTIVRCVDSAQLGWIRHELSALRTERYSLIEWYISLGLPISKPPRQP